jgi:hypothetical protein
VSSSREDPGAWPRDPEASSASGGHVAPGAAGGPLFDPLTAPLPSERARQEGTYGDDAGPHQRIAQRVERAAPPRPQEEPRPSTRRRRVASRRVRRTVKKVDPLSVLKLSAFFYAVLLVVWLIVVAILYRFVDGLGVFNLINDLGRGFAIKDWQSMQITLGRVERWAFFIGLLTAVIASVVNMVLAMLYNIAADLFGGLELTFVERDS